MKIKSWIKEIATGIVLIILFANIIGYIRQPEPVSTQLPEATVSLIDGNSYRLHRGKPVVIHFWAVWCRVCKVEASNIEKLSEKYDVLTIAVNSGEDGKIRDYMQKYDLHFKVLNDKEGKWASRFNVEMFPTTFMYDAKGELGFAEVGYTTTAGLLARMKMLE